MLTLRPWQVRALLAVGRACVWLSDQLCEIDYNVTTCAMDHCPHPDAQICADQVQTLLVRCRICGDFADGIVHPLETVPAAARRFLREKQQRQIAKRRAR